MSTYQERMLDIVKLSNTSHASANIEHDRQLGAYVVGADTLTAVKCVAEGMNGSKRGMAVSIMGPYGSGKSTLGLFVNNLVGPEREFEEAVGRVRLRSNTIADLLVTGRRKMDVGKDGMIRCRVVARREPIHATILRALGNGVREWFGKRRGRKFDRYELLSKNLKAMERGVATELSDVMPIIRGMCARAPVMLMIDEFGKNIEYFTTDEASGDLFLLQEIAEASGRCGLKLGIMTFQHMAFDDYAAGTSSKRRREWAKVQGRFEEVVFSNTLAQMQTIVSQTVHNSDSRVSEWAVAETRMLRNTFGIEFDPDVTARCYPLHPLTMAVLPELCSRYGQNERTLLSFLHGGGKHTVLRFIEETTYHGGRLPIVGIDMLYDYFISGAGTVHGSSASIARLREIESIIRDAHELGETEAKVLKTVGVLNLVGRTGTLRASRRMIEYTAGSGAEAALDLLASKSILTYRDRADEYRVWHGSDIDVSAKIAICRQRYDGTDINRLLPTVVSMEPVIASRHGIKTGTIRIFQQMFPEEDFDDSYDGAIMYGSVDAEDYIKGKPVIHASVNSPALAARIFDMRAMRDLLEEEDVLGDWVARNEINERLVTAESELKLEISERGGIRLSWRGLDLPKKLGLAASRVCDEVYYKTPEVFNEMINKNKISSQAASARNILVEAMVTRPEANRLGISGWGAERSIYEAVLKEHGIHRRSGISDPTKSMKHVWRAVLKELKKSSKRGDKIKLEDLYSVCRMPPFGMKNGTIPLMIVAMLIRHADDVALYEHGTFVNGIKADVAERLVKNPSHFTLKHFMIDKGLKEALVDVAAALGDDVEPNVLGIVKEIVGRISTLNEYARNTKKMKTKTMAVRDAIVKAREPDVLLMESIPSALGYEPISKMSPRETREFAKDLAKVLDTIVGWFSRHMKSAKRAVLEQIGASTVDEAIKKASTLSPYIAEKDMKPFMMALTANLDNEERWISYVTMTLAGVPPTGWRDEHAYIFKNKLHEMAGRFRRLAALRFETDGDAAILFTVTKLDGTEEYAVISSDEASDRAALRKRLNDIANRSTTSGRN